jgi:hypothetical protein
MYLKKRGIRMKIPENRIGLSTTGLTANVILAGVIFAGLNPWWLVLSILLVFSAIGIEVGKK